MPRSLTWPLLMVGLLNTSPLWRHAEVIEEERIDVRRLFQLLRCAAGAVARLGVDANYDRIVAGLRRL